MIEQALSKAGGVDYLLKQSEANPTAFMSLVRAILPRDINVSVTAGTQLIEAMQARRLALANDDTIEGEAIAAE